MNEDAKLKNLENRCRSLGALAVAFSGGLDSRFLCRVAALSRIPVRALHIAGPHIPRRETEEARQWAKEQGIPFILLHADPLQNTAVRANGLERCYHCKLAAFTMLFSETKEGEHLCDGTNASDLTGYRPGLRALKELGVISPLAEEGLTKGKIRSLAEVSGMDRPEQQARPCLLTRYEYGMVPDVAGLAALEAAERAVEHIFTAKDQGPIPPFRLRLTATGPVLHIRAQHFTNIATDELLSALNAHGFADAGIEAVEHISGFFDRQRNLVPA